MLTNTKITNQDKREHNQEKISFVLNGWGWFSSLQKCQGQFHIICAKQVVLPASYTVPCISTLVHYLEIKFRHRSTFNHSAWGSVRKYLHAPSAPKWILSLETVKFRNKANGLFKILVVIDLNSIACIWSIMNWCRISILQSSRQRPRSLVGRYKEGTHCLILQHTAIQLKYFLTISLVTNVRN
jgi:hypothetical protein